MVWQWMVAMESKTAVSDAMLVLFDCHDLRAETAQTPKHFL
jgi:hypothetical protein